MFGLNIFNKKEVEGSNNIQLGDHLDNELKAMYSTPLEGVATYYDGEKTPGELGIARHYISNFDALRVRSWQSYFESDITQAVINKKALWVVGKGLTLQSDPLDDLITGLSKEEKQKFTKQVELRFKLWANSNFSDYSRKHNLNKLAKSAYLNRTISGDVLVILRAEKEGLSVQLVDGAHIQTPMEKIGEERIEDGIKFNARGEHVEYYIANEDLTYTTVKARDSNGRKVAYLVYGSEYRIDDNRGMPVIAPVMQSLKILDRYKEAIVGGAEERAKVAMFIEHDLNATGESPFTKVGLASNGGSASQSSYEQSDDLCKNINYTQQKEVYNMPTGSTLKSIESKQEEQFKEFYDTNFEYVAAALMIPPDVAKSLYNSSYSASRAAIKDFEHVLVVERDDFMKQFYAPIYSYWLDLQIMTGAIKVKGYMAALASNDLITLDAFKNARFVGANVPHIDPVKEVTAERLKLGSEGAHIPLTNAAMATENVNGGEFEANQERIKDELKQTIEKEEVIPPSSQNQQTPPED
jgi:capsid protein